MERSRNRQKLSDSEQNISSIDGISGLPDSILCHILSFLPTKVSVATSILARRWKILWAYVPNLDFDVNVEDDDTKLKTQTSFSNVITRVMFLHKLQWVSTFRLRYHTYEYDCDEYQFQTWIITAILRNVQNLDIYNLRDVTLPRCLFTSKTLVDLRLHRCGGIPLTGAVCLPRLKKLHLMSIQYKSAESLPRLLSGCPVLEELIIGSISDDVSVCFNISSPTIKSLKLDFQFDDYGYYSDYYRVEINTPALRYLQIKDYLSRHINAGALTSLIEADICFNDRYNDKTLEDVLKFADRLCNVECLKLELYHSWTEFVNAPFSASDIRFHNLRKLELTADCLSLRRFLENANYLEILIYQQICEIQEGWVEPKQVPSCMLSHLRAVRIVEMEGTEHELGMVRYLLSNGQVLKRMEIIYSVERYFNSDEKAEIVEKITQFERGSEACELAFC